MAKRSKNVTKLRLLRGVGVMALVATLSVSSPRPAHAIDLVADVINEAQSILTQINSAATAASTYLTSTLTGTLVSNSFMQQVISAWQQASDAVGKALQTQASGLMQNTAAANARTNVDVASAEAEAMSHHLPSFYSSCMVAKSARATEDARDQINQAGAGMANSGGNRPADPASVAKDTAAEIQAGLAPCTPGLSTSGQDTEYSSYKALGCSQKYGGHWEKADTTPAVFRDRQLPVPPDFQLPVNGVPQPIKPVSSEKYMPFLAAYSYCQKISMRLPPAPQMKGAVNVDAAQVQDHVAMIAATSVAYSKCIDLLTERMQIPSNTNNAAYKDIYKNQAAACQGDTAVGIVDGDPTYSFKDGSSGTCQSDGRSALQADWDRANRDSAQAYHSKYLAGVTVDGVMQDLGSVRRERQELQDSIKRNIDGLAAAKSAADNAARFSPNPLQGNAPTAP